MAENVPISIIFDQRQEAIVSERIPEPGITLLSEEFNSLSPHSLISLGSCLSESSDNLVTFLHQCLNEPESREGTPAGK